jgi:hypothetical protein
MYGIPQGSRSGPLLFGLTPGLLQAHETDVVGMGIASNGKYIISCSNKTDLVVWDLKGQILAQVDTYLMSTTCAKISPCGRFVVASGEPRRSHFTRCQLFLKVSRRTLASGRWSSTRAASFKR